jgi:hypothetical protein
MGNMTPSERPVPGPLAYPRGKRVRHAFWFLREMAKRGPDRFERTIARRIAETYRPETALIKRMKARFRNELSFGEGK